MAEPRCYGGIEFGGTKIVVAVGSRSGDIRARTALPTREPAAVLPEIAGFLAGCGMVIHGLGVGAFGPIVVDPESPRYGQLLATNKPGWSGYNLVNGLAGLLGVPVNLVTDVAAAAVGEARLGALRGAPLGLYLTVGTGIGGAVVAHGELLPALLHPEMGHITVRRAAFDQAASCCRFHDDCVEGLAAGPAIKARFGEALSQFRPDGDELALIAHYLGQLCASLTLTLSPHRIVLGGGVGKTPGLLPRVHDAMLRHLGGYAGFGLDRGSYIVPPQLGDDAGVIGALVGAARADAGAKPAAAPVTPARGGRS